MAKFKEVNACPQRQRATETEEDRCSQLGLTNLAEFICYSISGGGRLPQFMRCLRNRFVLT